MKIIKYIDLFCGLGAFHTAFNRSSNNKIQYQCVYACDIDNNVRDIYYENYGIKPEGDINKVDFNKIPNFDILCGGFPCQPFSIAGKKEGFDDKAKGNLFYKIMEIVDLKQPRIIFLENVKNLHLINDGKTFQTIKNEIEKRGYHFNFKIINSKYYNSPQSRERIFIICDKKQKYLFQEPQYPLKPVSQIIDHSVQEYFDYKNKYNLQKTNGSRMMIYKLINKNTGKGGRQGERVYSINQPGATICASGGGVGAQTGFYEINGKIRTLTIGEVIQMFGFDSKYKYTTLKKKQKMLFYLGNSIVVNVLEDLIRDFDF